MDATEGGIAVEAKETELPLDWRTGGAERVLAAFRLCSYRSTSRLILADILSGVVGVSMLSCHAPDV